MEVDRLRAKEERGSSLAVRQAVHDCSRNVELLRGQRVEARRSRLARQIARGTELGPCALGPRPRAELIENGKGGTERFPRVEESPRAAEALPVGKLRSRALELRRRS